MKLFDYRLTIKRGCMRTIKIDIDELKLWKDHIESMPLITDENAFEQMVKNDLDIDGLETFLQELYNEAKK